MNMNSPYSVWRHGGAWRQIALLTLAIVSAIHAAEPVPPGAPGPITVSGVTRVAATLSWGAASGPAGVTLVYTVQLRKRANGIAGEWIAAGETGATTKGVDGLVAATTYDVRVRAGANAVAGPWTAKENAFTTDGAPVNRAPSIPGAIAISDVTTQSARVTWGASTDADGDAVSYVVSIRKRTASATWVTAGDARATSLLLSGLSAGTGYDVRVQASDGKASSEPKILENAFVTTGEPVPAAPGAPGAITVSGVTQTAATLSWGAASGPAGVTLVYTIQLRKRVNGAAGEWVAAGETTSTTKAVDGLAAGTTYDVQVRAWAKTVAGPWTAKENAFTTVEGAPANRAPSTPGAITISNVSDQSVQLAWGASTDPEGNAVTYSVSIRKRGGTPAAWQDVGSNLTNPSLLLIGLPAGTAFDVRVQASDGKVVSEFRALENAFTTTGGEVKTNTGPTTPGDIAISEVSSRRAKISWGSSTDANGDSVVYLVALRKRLNGAAQEWGSARDTASTSLVYEELTSGMSYDVRVRAFDGKAYSDWKVKELAFITPAGDKPQPLGGVAAATVRNEAGMVVTWPSDKPGVIVIEAADSLNSTAWQKVEATVDHAGGINASALPIEGRGKFFRLRRQE